MGAIARRDADDEIINAPGLELDQSNKDLERTCPAARILRETWRNRTPFVALRAHILHTPPGCAPTRCLVLWISPRISPNRDKIPLIILDSTVRFVVKQKDSL